MIDLSFPTRFTCPFTLQRNKKKIRKKGGRADITSRIRKWSYLYYRVILSFAPVTHWTQIILDQRVWKTSLKITAKIYVNLAGTFCGQVHIEVALGPPLGSSKSFYRISLPLRSWWGNWYRCLVGKKLLLNSFELLNFRGKKIWRGKI